MSASDSCSDDEYGPPLPPGFASSNSSDLAPKETKSIRPALPPSFLNKPSSSQNTDHSRSSGSKRYSSDSGHSSESDFEDIGPALPPGFKKPTVKSSTVTDSSSKVKAAIGPALPPHLQTNSSRNSDNDSDSDEDRSWNQSRYIGPVIPGQSDHLIESDEEEDGAYIGPMPGEAAKGDYSLTAAEEFEIRAKKMKDKLLGKEEEKAPEREGWMMELPPAIGKDYGLENRSFRKTAAPSGDRSGWTDTPGDKEKREEKQQKRKHDEPDVGHAVHKDKKIRDEIDKYNKKHRSESLLDKHQKKIKKEKKKEKKKKKEESNERRPFDRDADLQVNKMDDAKRRAIIKRSQDLNGRFKSGGMGTSSM